MFVRESEEEFKKDFYGILDTELQDGSPHQEDKDDEENESFLYEGGASDKSKRSQQLRERKVIDYKYMDGLRGFGAFAVYVTHFFQFYLPIQSIAEQKHGVDVVQPPYWAVVPPLGVIRHGQLWVCIFFILSGFVLPLNYFKTGRSAALQGGVMRRYFRLMLPVLMVLSIYYLTARFDLYGKSTYNKIKGYGFGQLIWAACLETWWGGWSFMAPTWTLGIEFWATFMIYLTALTGHNYKGRFFFYCAIVIFFFTMQYIGFLNLTYFRVNMFLYQLPYFFIGVIFSDMENMVERPLDKIRNLHWGWKIPLNAVLIAMFLIWGSSMAETRTECLTGTDDRCPIYVYASLQGFLPYRFTLTAASLAAIILAFTSDVFAWILGSFPIQFLGKVSYTLYLIHMLFIDWLMRDTYNYFVDEQEVKADDAVWYVFFIYTPILFAVAWILEIIVDNPAKQFAGEFDRQIRRQRPNPVPEKNPETGELVKPDKDEYYSTGAFAKRIWPIYVFAGWLLLVFISTEIFAANHTYKDIEEPEWKRYRPHGFDEDAIQF